MKKKTIALPNNLKVAIKRFPKIVENKAKAASARQRFVEETFGKLVRKIDKNNNRLDAEPLPNGDRKNPEKHRVQPKTQGDD